MLFNRLVGKRMSIVEDTRGHARQALYRLRLARSFTPIDTGGTNESGQRAAKFMREQAEIAIDHADVIILLTDLNRRHRLGQGSGGFSAALRQAVILAVNKADSVEPPPDFYEFYNLDWAT